MAEFFQVRSRKIGVVTLLLACVFMAGWVRSQTIEDSFPLIASEIKSREGFIEQTVTFFQRQPNSSSAVFHQRILWKLPYCSIAVPLTLISLWLLFSKPRTSIPKKITEPIPDEGGV